MRRIKVRSNTNNTMYPRVRWWKKTIGVDWFDRSSSTPEDITLGSELILWGSVTITFED